MLLYYITDRRQFSGSPAQQHGRLLDKIAEAARCGVDFIQLREQDLTTRELEQLAREALQVIRDASAPARSDVAAPRAGLKFAVSPALETGGGRKLETRLLINSRTDVALAVSAAGVHLRADDIAAGDVRMLWSRAAAGKRQASSCLVAVSCHTAAEVRLAEAQGADFAVFAPVFEKSGRPGVGVDALLAACATPAAVAGPEPSAAAHFAVLALGGVGLENTATCLSAGAAGVAAIRLFQENDLARLVPALRRLG